MSHPCLETKRAEKCSVSSCKMTLVKRNLLNVVPSPEFMSGPIRRELVTHRAQEQGGTWTNPHLPLGRSARHSAQGACSNYLLGIE